ncbi:MAG: FAD-binding protein, partial [Muribaculaceae bacterium]|nr:FAD-binding protein [Muribaculaceae bacterium]
LHQHGASSDILIDAHPHIGSDKLPEVIKNIRNTILEAGGEVKFSTKVVEILLDGKKAVGVKTADGDCFYGPVVLATGHSARDVYRMLHNQGIKMEAKGLAMGVRLEHPQNLIDCLQYHSPQGRGNYLPAAEYSYVTQVNGRGVYSFCMCPGGVIVPAMSDNDQSVVNGMSASARASQWANSGMVVELHPGDIPGYSDKEELEMMCLQEALEKKFYEASDGTINAPAQRMIDFTTGKASETLPRSSYPAGIHSARLDLLLPEEISSRLKEGFKIFDKKSRGFLTNEAILVGLEARTSSPVRIPRDKDSLQHLEIENLFPAGEGAGYAGGIVSAAIDGQRCVEAYIKSIKSNGNNN